MFRPAAVGATLARRPTLWITLAMLLALGVVGLLRARGPLVDAARVTRTAIEQHHVGPAAGCA
jgi:hypothetical protein